MDFHDLDFVEAPSAPGPSTSVFSFCRPESFLFKCYVCGFVKADSVFSKNASTKSEAPTPSGQFFLY